MKRIFMYGLLYIWYLLFIPTSFLLCMVILMVSRIWLFIKGFGVLGIYDGITACIDGYKIGHEYNKKVIEELL